MKFVVLLSLFVPRVLPAQRNELSLQFGTTLTQRRELAVPAQLQNLLQTDALREDNGLAGGLVYRFRIAQPGPVALMAEIPVFLVQATNTDLLPAFGRNFFGNTSGVSGFFTPGLAMRLLPDSTLSPYGFFGGGYARLLVAEVTSTTPVRGDFVDRATWAISYGGGVDLRLVRFLGLRAELRNFYAGANDSGLVLVEESRQRNTLLLTGGLVFRF